jgi:hypothetical protein
MPLEKIWKQAVVANSRYYPGIYQEDLRKTLKHVRLVGVPTKIRTKQLPNTLEPYRYPNLPDVWVCLAGTVVAIYTTCFSVLRECIVPYVCFMWSSE